MLLHALGCHLGLCWAAYFDDFPMASRDAASASTMAAAKAMLYNHALHDAFVGKLQFADAQLWGRAGRMALHDLRSYGHIC